MAANRTSFTADEGTLKILDTIPNRKRSEFIRDAIQGKHSRLSIEEKLDEVLGELLVIREALVNSKIEPNEAKPDELLDAIESSMADFI